MEVVTGGEGRREGEERERKGEEVIRTWKLADGAHMH